MHIKGMVNGLKGGRFKAVLFGELSELMKVPNFLLSGPIRIPLNLHLGIGSPTHVFRYTLFQAPAMRFLAKASV